MKWTLYWFVWFLIILRLDDFFLIGKGSLAQAVVRALLLPAFAVTLGRTVGNSPSTRRK